MASPPQVSRLTRFAYLLLFASSVSFFITSRSLGTLLSEREQEGRLMQLAFTGANAAEVNVSTISQDTPIPEALLPVTFVGCCERKEDLFPQTCLTEKACNNSLYPFRSQEEATMFERWKPTQKEAWKHAKKCKMANAQLTPEHRWCSSKDDNSSMFPFGCTRPLGMGGGSGPWDRLYLFPHGKLLFCGIPKAGITNWLHLLRFIIGAKDYQSIPYCKMDADKFRFDRLTPRVQEQVWSDPSWTRAVLIREPAERVLSAYLDKVQTRDDKRQPNPPFGFNVSFAEFIDILSLENVSHGVNETHGAMTGLSWMSDPHWRPQAWSCGLSENMARFEYVGGLDRAAHHSKAILQKVNLWESFGKHYRVTERGKHYGTHAAVTWPPEPLKPGEKAVGFQQELRKEDRQGGITTRHSHASWKKMNQYYTPELLKKVKKIYWMDFALWDALQEAQEEGKVHGKDMVGKLNSECAR